jgi:hypothetical protein
MYSNDEKSCHFFEKFAFVAQTLLFLYFTPGPRDIYVESTRSSLCGAQAHARSKFNMVAGVSAKTGLEIARRYTSKYFVAVVE